MIIIIYSPQFAWKCHNSNLDFTVFFFVCVQSNEDDGKIFHWMLLTLMNVINVNNFVITILANSTRFLVLSLFNWTIILAEYFLFENTRLENDWYHYSNSISMDFNNSIIFSPIKQKLNKSTIKEEFSWEKIIKLKWISLSKSNTKRLIWNRLRAKVHWNNV